MCVIKDSKSKQDYLLNPNINTEVISQLRDLCSLQSLAMAYLNLNSSLLLLIKPKIKEISNIVIEKQLKMLIDVIENPTTKFLNHSNIGQKCQHIVNFYVSTLSSEMSPINILNEVSR